MAPRTVVEKWVAAFNKADVAALEQLYAADAVNHQMPNEAVQGRAAIAEMFRTEFAAAAMHCQPIQIIEEGHWAVLEWKDPNGLQGCGFFEIENGQIKTQRGYWDKLSFERLRQTPPARP